MEGVSRPVNQPLQLGQPEQIKPSE